MNLTIKLMAAITIALALAFLVLAQDQISLEEKTKLIDFAKNFKQLKEKNIADTEVHDKELFGFNKVVRVVDSKGGDYYIFMHDGDYKKITAKDAVVIEK